MNFLLSRSNQTAAAEQAPSQDYRVDASLNSKNAVTLEGLIAEDPFPATYHHDGTVGSSSENISFEDGSVKNETPFVDRHMDVSDEEGWITIPCKEIPDNWSEGPDMLSYRSFDRTFVFPGEQVHILAGLSAYKQDTEIITPFKVAEVMNKNGMRQNNEKQHDSSPEKKEPTSDFEDGNQNSTASVENSIDLKTDVSAGESLVRMEDHRRQTESLLLRFKNSHFFARIAASDEPLWSKRKSRQELLESFETEKGANTKASLNAAVDRGGFDPSTCGGIARNTFKCTSLPNGDIVLLLQVNIGVNSVPDPVLEILQFERYQERGWTSEVTENLASSNQDPCGDLLKWLLPLDNTIIPPARSLSPPPKISSSIRSTSSRTNISGTSGSQILSHFRSYSMSSIQPSTLPPTSGTSFDSKPSFDLENWDRFSSNKTGKLSKFGNEGISSFRGVPLEPERFSVRCGLEGIYVPGRRWRKKIEIIQPVKIHSFASDCNTEDLLCVQIKNVSPAHVPDIVIYLDAITIIFEEASKGGPPSSLPIACIEAGDGHSLPNLALRQGEEHSFILKPTTSIWKDSKGQVQRTSGSNIDRSLSLSDQYSVLVSCRCNYTESRLFFKQPTSWRPRIPRDLLISVASQMSRQTIGSDERVPQLPVQVLTLQASNLTSEDLTLTVLAPASFSSPPSVLSLNSSPSSPVSPLLDSSQLVGTSYDRNGTAPESRKSSEDGAPQTVSLNDQAITISDVLPRSDSGCTHLWLQSRVPLGCIPSRSTATIKLELLPLTDGIITLDSLRIGVKEKGRTYIPEHSLKIYATSSILTGIV